MTPPSLVPAQENYGRRPAIETPRLCWYPGAESYGSILQGEKDAPAHCCCSAGQAVGLAYKTGLQYTCPRVPCKLVAVSGEGSQYRVTVDPEWASPVPLHSEWQDPHRTACPYQVFLPAGLCPKLWESQAQSQTQSPRWLQEVLVAKDRLAISVQPGSALLPSWPPWGARLPPTRKKKWF